jgi:prolipoprotein diacylglyceryltransferase
MRQVLFVIPLHDWIGQFHPWLDFLPNIPVYGYGAMLFLAYIFCQAMGKRLSKREGIDASLIPDLTIWLFVSGIVGGRLVFIATEWHNDIGTGFDSRPWWDFVKLWDGGLVLYGAIFGAAIGFFAYYQFVLRKHGVSVWKILDIAAPCVALGIAFGRIGCLFTGCCYGNVACPDCPAIHFPLYTNTSPPAPTAPAAKMIGRGYQTPLGFLINDDTLAVEAVERGSAAADVLRTNDVIVGVNGKAPLSSRDIVPVNGYLQLTVIRDGKNEVLPPFAPKSIGLNPTQIYETISMSLLLFFLLSYYPYKRRDGELMVLLMFGYGVHRFLNEMLRLDTDPGIGDLTLSQIISLFVLAGAVVLAIVVWRRPVGRSQESGVRSQESGIRGQG